MTALPSRRSASALSPTLYASDARANRTVPQRGDCGALRIDLLEVRLRVGRNDVQRRRGCRARRPVQVARGWAAALAHLHDREANGAVAVLVQVTGPDDPDGGVRLGLDRFEGLVQGRDLLL